MKLLRQKVIVNDDIIFIYKFHPVAVVLFCISTSNAWEHLSLKKQKVDSRKRSHEFGTEQRGNTQEGLEGGKGRGKV